LTVAGAGLYLRSSAGANFQKLRAASVLDALIEVADVEGFTGVPADSLDELVSIEKVGAADCEVNEVTVLARRARLMGAMRIRGWTLTDEGKVYDARRVDESGPVPAIGG